KGKTVVLGLVSSKLPQLEAQKELVDRIEEAGKFMPLQNLALSPQCGFASTMEGNLLTEDQQWRKLDLVAKTARQVWQDASRSYGVGDALVTGFFHKNGECVTRERNDELPLDSNDQ